MTTQVDLRFIQDPPSSGLTAAAITVIRSTVSQGHPRMCKRKKGQVFSFSIDLAESPTRMMLLTREYCSPKQSPISRGIV
uniref:Uncharacterized protein n=1 Tax=Candidatus Kentrum sp. FW TaxID=2126338 RepID=A0A450U197_9GAMM|nr:MAG: hypothetical protein BECKFW1821C_GA0114237_10975 [Candidatus Kentron sp. FW]